MDIGLFLDLNGTLFIFAILLVAFFVVQSLKALLPSIHAL